MLPQAEAEPDHDELVIVRRARGTAGGEPDVRFRDWLRDHDDDRELYERTKRELAARTWRHVQHYADAKTPVVQEIMARATAGSAPLS